MALIHGGQLQQVAKQFNIAPENWLDLSTGIAPFSYPIPDIPEKSYQELPQSSHDLETAAKHYYDANSLLVTNGSQAIIKLLPTLWSEQNSHSTTVYLPEQGYKEHALAWQTAGFTLCWYQDELPAFTEIKKNSVLVIINPNNPTGQLYNRSILINYQEKLAKCNSLLVIDEAFIDVIKPSQSMTNTINNSNNTLILRSFGKFFGLAGIRIGFLIGEETWLEKFREHLGAWQVNGPAQYIAGKALVDKRWQKQQQQNLKTLSARLRAVLAENVPFEFTTTISGTDLFQTVYFKEGIDVEHYYVALCQQGVYVRLTDDKRALRFGLAKVEQLERLANALASINN
ncbi:threonine-phosphate decarboxylase CobD [Candidatus Colwellia aromaticivorans]|uniref:threonine-phosphate decarboxylase CobD n=1 Tax=Candidatus Colwellia aromaticivorans TaxID=2267621 RepID=UPI000DF46B71|nr:threonine-phosphate decarboxylase CobD [Candidatus Colwellia aromaticivorans]